MLKKIEKYWNKKPCNINHSSKKFLSLEYFNEVKKKKYFVEDHIPKFANFKKYKGKNVLEIGCGIGTDAIEFIRNGANYIGVDLSQKSIDICNTRVNTYKLNKKNPKFIKDNCENLNNITKYLKKNNIKLDLIYSFGVIHHTKNMKKAFESIYNISNKKTEIKIMLYAKNSYKNFLLNVTNYRYERQKACPVVHRVSSGEINNLIKKKFKILKQYQDFIFQYQISPYKKNEYIKIKHFEFMPKKIFRELKKNIGEHLMLELTKI
jgi:SAM-dependent methyltransferase